MYTLQFIVHIVAASAAPAPPVLTLVGDFGTPSAGIINLTTLTFDAAAAEPIDNVLLYRNGAIVASRIGPGRLIDPGPLSDGHYSYTSGRIDSDGLAGLMSNALVIIIDTTPPAAPVAPRLQASSDSGRTDNITNVTNPVFDLLTTEVDNTIQLLRDGVAVASRIGTGPLEDPGPISKGANIYTALQTDEAGNIGSISPELLVVIDTMAPPTPAVALDPVSDSGILGDNVTNVARPWLTGMAEPGTAVDLLDATGHVVGSGMAATDGSYRITPDSPFVDRTYSLKVRATDLAGNVSPLGPTFTLTIDTTPPTAPGSSTLSPSSDTGPPGDGITSNRQPTLTGTAEASSTVQLLDGSGNVLGSTCRLVDRSLRDRPHLPPQRPNLFAPGPGNRRGGQCRPGGYFDLAHDRHHPPCTPSVLTLLAADDSGKWGTGSRTSTPRLTGTAEPGSTVQLLGSAARSSARPRRPPRARSRSLPSAPSPRDVHDRGPGGRRGGERRPHRPRPWPSRSTRRPRPLRRP